MQLNVKQMLFIGFFKDLADQTKRTIYQWKGQLRQVGVDCVLERQYILAHLPLSCKENQIL